MRNLITDVPGLRVGHAEDMRLGSGATAIIFEEPAVGSIDVRGGGPGTRETALLDPAQTVEGIDAITLSGGSAFGLDAASGVQAWLREQSRGFVVRAARVPIVPAAILFDLLAAGDKDWGRYPPYRELGYAAAAAASQDFALGSVGAGTGATTVELQRRLRLGVGPNCRRITVGAIAAVNARRQRHRRRRPVVLGGAVRDRRRVRRPRLAGQFSTTGFRAAHQRHAARKHHARRGRDRRGFDQSAGQARCRDGASRHVARDLSGAHARSTATCVFAASTGRRPLPEGTFSLTAIGTLAANVVARAIARSVFAPGLAVAWSDAVLARPIRPLKLQISCTFRADVPTHQRRSKR